MSDTDDTDVLILIPPNFFLIQTDSEDEKPFDHFSVVDTLISQVHNLESRLNKLEVNTEQSYSSISSCSTIIPMSDMSEQPYRNDSYLLSSTKSTPQKPKGKFNANSLPTTPSTERPGSQRYVRPPRFRSRLPPKSIIRSVQNQSTDADESSFSGTPEKADKKRMLGEIDQFLSNVKTIQTVTSRKTVGKPHESQIKLDEPVLTLNDLKSGTDESVQRFNQLKLQDVDRLLQAIESQQRFMDLGDSKVESLYENKNFSKSEQSQNWFCGDTVGSVPELDFGMRNLLYDENVPNDEPIDSKSDSQSNSETLQTVLEKQPTPKKLPEKIKSTPVKNTETQKSQPTKYVVNVENSSNDAIEIPNDLDAIHILPSAVKSVPAILNNSLHVTQPSSSISSINLFSLADIWNSNGKRNLKISDREMKQLIPKLEEEKCRRMHCEKLIQELQMKTLEMQQRLAVAVQLDSAKDEAILRFHDAWEKVANRWKSLESERNVLSEKLLAVEEKSSTKLSEAAQKFVQYELEISKALNIAHSNQERCNALEMERGDYNKKITELKLQLEVSQESQTEISKEKEKLCEKIVNLEKDALLGKKILLETQNEVSKSKTVFLSCQNELSILKDDYIKLEKKFKEKQALINELECERKNLRVSLETMQNNEAHLQQQIKILQEDSERTKHDLRNFYQQQVEVLVKDKLKEFQAQLEQAEKSLQDELQTREQSITKTAAKQIQKLSEKHVYEIQLIEEKHKEEFRLYELQFNQMKQKIHMLQSKIESYQTRRSTIAQELHNVMEQQWLEALRIINNGKSPLSSSPRPQGDSESSQNFNLNELKKILSAKENVRQESNTEQEQKIADFDQNNERYKVKLRSKNTVTDVPFRSLPEVFETPISSKQKEESFHSTESNLQKYVKMLLEKMPRNSTEKPSKEERRSQLSSQESSTSEFLDSSSWHPVSLDLGQKNERQSKDQRSGKPPWK